MKTLNIVLLILIIIGISLLATQKFWVPTLVMVILEHETEQQQLQQPEVAIDTPAVVNTPRSTLDTWNWVLSEVSSQGTQFLYPNPLPTTYITAQDWPPIVEVVAGAFLCEEGVIVGSDGIQKQRARTSVDGMEYCVVTSAEGAAGSTYTSYEYATAYNDSVINISFILRTPQCMNYDEPKRSECLSEQAQVPVDEIVHRIATSVTTKRL
jgi:hypothetical protein